MSFVLGSVLGASIGALGSLGGSGLSSWLGNYSSKKAQKRAYEYWKGSLKEGPLLTRQGLEAAGYNPMLALGSLGGQSFSANSSPSFVPVGDIVGSAREGSRLGNEIEKGIALENKKKELENANLESDLDTKELHRLQMEADRSLVLSQTERSDLAYGRDIADTITGIASTAGSLYSAKAMSDIARQNARTNARNATVNERRLNQHSYEVRRDAKGQKVGTIERAVNSRGMPSVDSSAKGSRPSVAPHVGSSARAVGSIAKQVAKELLFLAPAAATAYGVGELQNSADRRIKSDKRSNYGKGYKHFVPRLGL